MRCGRMREKLTQLKEMLKKDYHATEVILREEQRDDLLGGIYSAGGRPHQLTIP